MISHSRDVALVLVVVALAAGCASTRTAGSVSSGSAVSAPDCRDSRVLGLLGLHLDESLAVTSVTTGEVVPDDELTSTGSMAPAAAVLCSASGVVVDAAGSWQAVQSVRLDGDLTDLTELVDRGCAAADDGTGVVVWWLDALDRAVLADVPQGGCEATSVAEATDGLQESDEGEDPVQRASASADPDS